MGIVGVNREEWVTACNLRDRYWLYVVFNCASSHPQLWRVQDGCIPGVAQIVLRKDKEDKEDKGDKGDSLEQEKYICKNGMLPFKTHLVRGFISH